MVPGGPVTSSVAPAAASIQSPADERLLERSNARVASDLETSRIGVSSIAPSSRQALPVNPVRRADNAVSGALTECPAALRWSNEPPGEPPGTDGVT